MPLAGNRGAAAIMTKKRILTHVANSTAGGTSSFLAEAINLRNQARSNMELSTVNEQSFSLSGPLKREESWATFSYDRVENPITTYDLAANRARKICQSNLFNIIIIFFILFSGALVGIQTTFDNKDPYWSIILEWLIITVFTIEIMLKILAWGTTPWKYFTCEDWRWNTFDFFIVIFTLPIYENGNNQTLSALRLLRLMRLTKIFKRVPQLEIIITGLLRGFVSIGYILLLLSLCFYLFAVSGVFLFRDNDPFNFGSVPVAILTLFRCATLEDWSEVMYVNMYGCDKYNGGIYYPSDNVEKITKYGEWFRPACSNPSSRPYITPIYFTIFIVLSSFVILSLFIGAVAVGMTESIYLMNQRKKEKKKGAAEEVLNNMNRMWLKHLIGQAWSSKNISFRSSHSSGSIKYKYLKLSHHLDLLTNSKKYNHFITFFILLAGIIVGISTEYENNMGIIVLDWIILVIFCIDILLRLLSYKFTPKLYFRDPWNRFDFFIVFTSLIFAILGIQATFVGMLRLLRLLRVLKLIKSLPQLRIIIEALIKGISSITFISILLFLFFYFFAIAGIILFKDNDPTRFGNLGKAFITLFQSATLDQWVSVMNINIYGCKNLEGSFDNWENGDNYCKDSQTWGWIAGIYFLIFTVIGALVLITLFVGVVTASMEDATNRMKEIIKIEKKVKRVQTESNLDDHGVETLKEVFKTLDIGGRGFLDLDQMRPVIQMMGNLAEDDILGIFLLVDEDDSGEINFAEFLQFLVFLRRHVLGMDKTIMRRATIKSNKKMRRHSSFISRDNSPDQSADEEKKKDKKEYSPRKRKRSSIAVKQDIMGNLMKKIQARQNKEENIEEKKQNDENNLQLEMLALQRKLTKVKERNKEIENENKMLKGKFRVLEKSLGVQTSKKRFSFDIAPIQTIKRISRRRSSSNSNNNSPINFRTSRTRLSSFSPFHRKVSNISNDSAFNSPQNYNIATKIKNLFSPWIKKNKIKIYATKEEDKNNNDKSDKELLMKPLNLKFKPHHTENEEKNNFNELENDGSLSNRSLDEILNEKEKDEENLMIDEEKIDYLSNGPPLTKRKNLLEPLNNNQKESIKLLNQSGSDYDIDFNKNDELKAEKKEVKKNNIIEVKEENNNNNNNNMEVKKEEKKENNNINIEVREVKKEEEEKEKENIINNNIEVKEEKKEEEKENNNNNIKVTEEIKEEKNNILELKEEKKEEKNNNIEIKEQMKSEKKQNKNAKKKKMKIKMKKK